MSETIKTTTNPITSEADLGPKTTNIKMEDAKEMGRKTTTFVKESAKKSAKNMKELFEALSRNVSLESGSFVVPIILYIISFFQLFHHRSTEYLSWILLFILNNTFPFVWMKEFVKMGSLVGKTHKSSGNMIMYSYMSIIVTYLLQFIILLFVILKNENVRRGKARRGEFEKEGNHNIKTNDRAVEKRDKIVSILYIISNVLIWVMMGDQFSTFLNSNLFDPKKVNNPDEMLRTDFPIGTRIKSFTDFIPSVLEWMDKKWRGMLSLLMPFPNLSKAFLMYCITFLIVIFTFFIRLKYRRANTKHGDANNRPLVTDGYDVVNIGNLFGGDFYRNTIHYRNLAKVMLVVLITLILTVGFTVFCIIFGKSFTHPLIGEFTPVHILFGMVICCIVALFPAFFAKHEGENKLKEELFEPHDKTYYTEDITFDDLNIDDTTIISNFPNDTVGKATTTGQAISVTLSGEINIKEVINNTALFFNQQLFVYDDDDEISFSFNVDNGDSIETSTDDTRKNWDYLVKKYKNLETEIQYIDEGMRSQFTENLMIHFQHNMEQIYGNSKKVQKNYIADRNFIQNNRFGSNSFTFNDMPEFKGKRKELESKRNHKPLKRFIFFLMCLFFGIMGSPVVITLFELGFKTVQDKWFLAETPKRLFVSFIGIMVALTMIMFGIGVDKEGDKNNVDDFISDQNYKKMQTFLAILITMVVSSFFALSTQYNIFLGMWRIPGSIISLFTKTLGPLAIMLFASLSMFYSYENYKKFRKRTAE